LAKLFIDTLMGCERLEDRLSVGKPKN